MTLWHILGTAVLVVAFFALFLVLTFALLLLVTCAMESKADHEADEAIRLANAEYRAPREC